MIRYLGSIKIKIEIWSAKFLLNAKHLILKHIHCRKDSKFINGRVNVYLKYVPDINIAHFVLTKINESFSFFDVLHPVAFHIIERFIKQRLWNVKECNEKRVQKQKYSCLFL